MFTASTMMPNAFKAFADIEKQKGMLARGVDLTPDMTGDENGRLVIHCKGKPFNYFYEATENIICRVPPGKKYPIEWSENGNSTTIKILPEKKDDLP